VAGLIAGAPALVLNLFPWDYLPGVAWYVGGVGYLVAALAVGPWAGALAALLAGGAAAWTSGHLGLIFLMVAEAWGIGWLRARGWSTLAAGSGFWLLAGAPTLAVLGYLHAAEEPGTAWTLALSTLLSEWIALALAEFLVVRGPVARWLPGARRAVRSLREQVFVFSLVLSTSLILVAAVLVSHQLGGLERQRADRLLSQAADDVAARLQRGLALERRLLAHAAGAAGYPAEWPAASWLRVESAAGELLGEAGQPTGRGPVLRVPRQAGGWTLAELRVHQLAALDELPLEQDRAVAVLLDPARRIQYVAGARAVAEAWLASGSAPRLPAREYLVRRQAVGATGWELVLLYSALPAQALLQQLYQRILLYLLLALAFSVVLSRWLALHVSRPLVGLLGAMARFQPGAGERPAVAAGLEGAAPSEVSDLAARFDELGRGLDESYQNLERRVEERTGQLNEARALAVQASLAKSEFLAEVSQEIRGPMNGIQGMIQLLWLSELTPQQSQYLQGMEEAAGTLQELVESLADLTRIEAGEARLEVVEFEPGPELEALVRQLAPRAHAKGLRLQLERAAALPERARGDLTRVKRVLLQLLGNAIQYTQQGSVRVEASWAEGLTVAVRDTGPGIAGEALEHLRTRLQLGAAGPRRGFQGGGLGLAICARTLTLLAGRIEVRSALGEGSCFEVQIPLEALAGEPQADRPLRYARRLDWPGRPLRILLAEDQRISRIFATELLTRMGHQVETALNGRAALEQWRQGAYDLVLMDLQMPEMDGAEAVAAMRAEEAERGGHTPVVALTAHAMAGLRSALLERGFDGYLTKPLQVTRLCREMLEVLPAIELRGVASGGAEELARRMLSAFGQEYAHAAESLHRAVEAGDLEAAATLAHALRGAAGALEAQNLLQASAALEEACRRGNAAEARAQSRDLAVALEAVLEEARALETQAQPAAHPEPGPAVLLEKLELLARLLRGHDLAALALVEELIALGARRPRLLALRRLTDRLAFADAAALAEALMEELEADDAGPADDSHRR